MLNTIQVLEPVENTRLFSALSLFSVYSVNQSNSSLQDLCVVVIVIDGEDTSNANVCLVNTYTDMHNLFLAQGEDLGNLVSRVQGRNQILRVKC